MHRSMPPILSTRAQTQHPCRQHERDRDFCFARFLLVYSAISLTVQVNAVTSHRDMKPRHSRRPRWLISLLHLIRHEVHDIDYHHWKETHGTMFLCTSRPLSILGHDLVPTVRFSFLGISFILLCRINNGASEQTKQRTQLTGFATAR